MPHPQCLGCRHSLAHSRLGTSVPVSTRLLPGCLLTSSPLCACLCHIPFSLTGTSRTGCRAHTDPNLMTSVKTQGRTQGAGGQEMGRYLEGHNLIPSWLVPPSGCQDVHTLKDPFLRCGPGSCAPAIVSSRTKRVSAFPSAPSPHPAFSGPGALFLTFGSSHSCG